MNSRPQANEYASYYGKYINLVPEGNILEILSDQIPSVEKLFSRITEEKSKFRYAEGKWSIRELLGHITDTERVFAYRALRFSRNDKTALPGFEQDDFVPNSNHDNVLLKDLVEEFILVRKSNIKLFESFTDEMWLRTGTASENTMSARAVAFNLAGHLIHHSNVLKEKYL
ncbi:MAG: DinB family protein [Ignavibacteria bacterium]|nr:DinB family protein [Ignavibacteria bacterium]